MSGRSHLRALALLPCAIAGLGCAITLQHDPLEPADRVRSGPLFYEKSARGLSGRVGWGRGTLFAIPVVPIFIQGDQSYGNTMLMEQVRDAVEAAGYRPVLSMDAGDTPVLQCRIESASFNNYTWLFPIVPTWGGMKLRLELVTVEGEVPWSRTFEGDGFTLNFFNGYNSAAKQTLNEILADMVAALAEREFQVALEAARPPPVAETDPTGDLPPVGAEPDPESEPPQAEPPSEAEATPL